MQIAIIGAGIGGLVAAAGLQRDGHEITVLEKRQLSDGIGAGLSLFGNSLAALEAIGLGSVIAPLLSDEINGLTAGQRIPSGKWLVLLPPDALSSMRVMHRADLHQALTDALHPGTLCTAEVAQVSPDGTPTVIVAEGSEQKFDLVIAADGIHSDARVKLGLDKGVRYAGYTAWRGVTAVPVDILGEAGETWGRGRRFGVAPLPGGRVYWFATQTLPAHTVFEDDKGAVLARFGSWHRPIRELVEHTDSEAVLRHDIYDLARPLDTFVKGRTILLGDAAHAMPPDLGQGAGQAIEDAATLTLLLRRTRSDADVGNVLRIYDTTRRRRTRGIASKSRAMGRIGQLSSPIAVASRDALLNLAPARLIANAAVSLQRWESPR